MAKLGSFDPLSYCPWLLVVQRGGGWFLSELFVWLESLACGLLPGKMESVLF